MIITLLNAIAVFLVKSLKGFVSFLSEIIPLILKIVFTASPFVMFIVVSYLIGGNFIALVSCGVVFFIVLVGIGWAVKKKITDTKLTAEIVTTVLILDVILLTTPFLYQEYQRGDFIEKMQSLLVQNDNNKVKAQQFYNFLEESIANNKSNDIVRTIDVLKEMKYQDATSLIMTALNKYYPGYGRYHSEWDNKVSTSSIAALTELEASEACELLYKIQARKPNLYEIAKEATSKLCKE